MSFLNPNKSYSNITALLYKLPLEYATSQNSISFLATLEKTKLNSNVEPYFLIEYEIFILFAISLLSICSNVKVSKIRSGDMNEEETTRLLAGRATLDDLNIYLDDLQEATGLTKKEIKSLCGAK